MPQDIEHYENKFDTIRKTLDNYVKYECTRYNNRATPDRCWSAKDYRDIANEFMKKKIEDSKTNTITKLTPLFQDRITKKTDIYPSFRLSIDTINNNDKI